MMGLPLISFTRRAIWKTLALFGIMCAGCSTTTIVIPISTVERADITESPMPTLTSLTHGSLSAAATASQTATLTERPVSTPDPVATFAVTPTHTSTMSQTETNTNTTTPTGTYTLTATYTSTMSRTETSTSTHTNTPIPTPTITPWPTPDGAAHNRVLRVPILMYHYVSPLPSDADQMRIGLTTNPTTFRQQLALLRHAGYESISLYDLQAALAIGWHLPDKPVIFTFDDGYRGLYEYALPLMNEFGYTGTIFLPTQFVDEQRPEYLTWEMAMEMAKVGWRLEPHGKTHIQLAGLNRDQIVYEVLGSMQTIQAHVGSKPRFFSYPSGHYDNNVIAILKEIGFWGSVTTRTKLDHVLVDAYTRGRVRVDDRQDLNAFQISLGEETQGQ